MPGRRSATAASASEVGRVDGRSVSIADGDTVTPFGLTEIQ
jgi:hypothetical protein